MFLSRTSTRPTTRRDTGTEVHLRVGQTSFGGLVNSRGVERGSVRVDDGVSFRGIPWAEEYVRVRVLYEMKEGELRRKKGLFVDKICLTTREKVLPTPCGGKR